MIKLIEFLTSSQVLKKVDMMKLSKKSIK
jgi:hypothetical protein